MSTAAEKMSLQNIIKKQMLMKTDTSESFLDLKNEIISNDDSSKKFFQMKAAIDRRQEEIFNFFRVVKGTV